MGVSAERGARTEVVADRPCRRMCRRGWCAFGDAGFYSHRASSADVAIPDVVTIVTQAFAEAIENVEECFVEHHVAEVIENDSTDSEDFIARAVSEEDSACLRQRMLPPIPPFPLGVVTGGGPYVETKFEFEEAPVDIETVSQLMLVVDSPDSSCIALPNVEAKALQGEEPSAGAGTRRADILAEITRGIRGARLTRALVVSLWACLAGMFDDSAMCA